jgi:hypothetical protein
MDKYADVIIVVRATEDENKDGNKIEVKSHRYLLAKDSSYFDRMFSSQMKGDLVINKEGLPVYDLSEAVDLNIFSIYLDFLNTGNLKIVDSIQLLDLMKFCDFTGFECLFDVAKAAIQANLEKKLFVRDIALSLIKLTREPKTITSYYDNLRDEPQYKEFLISNPDLLYRLFTWSFAGKKSKPFNEDPDKKSASKNPRKCEHSESNSDNSDDECTDPSSGIFIGCGNSNVMSCVGYRN